MPRADSRDGLRQALRGSSSTTFPIQIHKGPLKKIVDWKGWLNVMDPGVEIHLKEDSVAQAWVVEKPTSDGRICSLELFDAQGNDIASMFGVRKEGKRQKGESILRKIRQQVDDVRKRRRL